jgi:PAS domain S-box-containing protein
MKKHNMNIKTLVLWAGAYVIAGMIVFSLQHSDGVSLWFPPIAIGTAFLVRYGRHLFPLVILLDLPISYLQFGSPGMAGMVSVGAVLEMVCMAYLVERFRLTDGQSDIGSLTRLIGLASVSAGAGATLSVLISIVTGNQAVDEAAVTWVQLWLGDWTSLVAFLPPLFTLFARVDSLPPAGKLAWRVWAAPTLLIGATVLIGLTGYALKLVGFGYGPPLVLFMIPVIWSAFKHGMAFTACLIMLTNMMAAVDASLGATQGIFLGPLDVERLAVQVGSIVIVVAGLNLAFTIERERRSRRKAEELRQRLTAILDTAIAGIITIDSKFNIVSFNQHAEEMFGWSAEEMIGGPLDRLLDPGIRDRHKMLMGNFYKGPSDRKAMSNWREVYGVHRNGERVPLAAVLSRVEVEGVTTMTVMLRNMSDIKAMEESLARALAEEQRHRAMAESANLAKTEFLATMSHELRTPLNAIIGFSSMMERKIYGPIGNEKYEAYVSDVRQSGEYLLSLINDVLDLSRIESKKRVLEVEQVLVEKVVDESVAMMSPIAKGRGVTLVAQVEPGQQVLADHRALQQVLINLVTNAIKFSPAGTQVKIGADVATGGRHRIYVSDQGIGISKADLANLASPFPRIHRPFVNANQGAGLGLAISKSLVESMDGKLTFESVVGAGTQVDILLPAA